MLQKNHFHKLDHITVVAQTIEDGIAHVKDQIGISAPVGGRHPKMGTHNHLLRLGEDLFLEIIAIDPSAQKPVRPRWFDLDRQSDRKPRLATWVISTPDIQSSLVGSLDIAGRATEITRGELAWKISIADNGQMPLSGAFPAIIEWPHGPHPATKMKEMGCHLKELKISHPDAGTIENFLDGRFSDTRVEITQSKQICLTAKILTPSGVFTLS